jgi:hypothetical protein
MLAERHNEKSIEVKICVFVDGVDVSDKVTHSVKHEKQNEVTAWMEAAKIYVSTEDEHQFQRLKRILKKP